MTPADIEVLLQEVHNLRTILINVGTGKLRIEDTESDYTQLRSHVSAKLQTLDVDDANTFVSLWDWHSYWKDNALTSYQSRRDYVNALYKPVLSALENAKADATAKPADTAPTFSARHGYADEPGAADITIREAAPEELRRTIIDIAQLAGWDCDNLFSVASRVGKKSWEPPEPVQSGRSSRVLLQSLMSRWEWYQVYDFIEDLFRAMKERGIRRSSGHDFETKLNEYFRHAGIGWELREGAIVSRGSEAFEASLRVAAPALQETGLQTAQREIHEALADLSRRPKPDITGAIQHAMAALECVARAVSGDSNPTLGKLLDRHPGLVPKPLDAAVEKAWGYASERGRHIREGEEPLREEAELIVGIAATVATYLARRAAIK